MAKETAQILIQLRGGLKAAREGKAVAGAMDDVGDETAQAGRKALEAALMFEHLQKKLNQVGTAATFASLSSAMLTASLNLLAVAAAGIAIATMPALASSLSSAAIAAVSLGAAVTGLTAAIGVMGYAAVLRFKETEKIAGSVADRLDDQAKLLKGAFSDATAAGATRVLAGLIPVLRGIRRLTRDLEPAFTAVGAAMGDALRWFGEGITELGPELSALLKSTTAAFQPIAQIALSVLSLLARIGTQAMPYVIEALDYLAATTMRWQRSVTDGAIAQAFAAIAGMVRGIAMVLGGVISALAPVLGPATADLIKTLNGAGETFGRAIGLVLAGIVQVGQGALPGLVRAVKSLTPALQAIIDSGVLKTIGKVFGDVFGKAASMVADVVLWLDKLGALRTVILSLVGAFVAWKVALVATSVALRIHTAYTTLAGLAHWRYVIALLAQAAAAKLLAIAQWALNAAMAANPVVLVVAAIAALAAGLVLAYHKVGWFRSAVDAVWGALRSVANWIRDNWQVALAILTGPFGLVVSTLVRGFGAIRGAASSTVQWIKNAFNNVVSFFSGLPGKIGAAVSGMWNGIKNGFRSVINWIIDGWNGLEFTVPKIDLGPLGSIGGGKIGMPDIPRLAKGGTVSGLGSWITGEAGPELNTTLPGGRVRVQPLRSAAGGGPRSSAVADGSLRSVMPDLVSRITLVADGRELAKIVDRQRLRAAEAR